MSNIFSVCMTGLHGHRTRMTRTAVDDCQWLKCDATKVLHCAALCLTQLLFADDLKMVAAGEDKYDRIWYMLMLWLMLGTPCRWPKFRGEVCLQFVGLDYCKFEVGLSERRTNWIVQWVETARQNGGVVTHRSFVELVHGACMQGKH